MQDAVHVSAIAADREEVEAVEVPVPVIEHVADPKAVSAPGGTVVVRATEDPEIVPCSVPVTATELPPLTTVTTRGPVTLVPLCVAAHVTLFESLPPVLAMVPDHVPARLIVAAGGGVVVVGAVELFEPPHAVRVTMARPNAVRIHP